MKKPLYYQNYHKHTSFSHRYNKDSPLIYNDYFNHMSNIKHPQSYCTMEHGWQGNYWAIYEDLEKFNSKNNTDIKFVFGTEAYWVIDRNEKDSSNCHICLLAMNDNGRKKLNRAIYDSFKTGYYYKNRMDMEILLSLPKSDIFVTSACIGYWKAYAMNDPLPFIDEDEEVTWNWDKIDEVVFKLNSHFDNFYLELQANNTEWQKSINKHIMDLHYEYNIPIIAGCDSHVIHESQIQDRDYLLKSNHIFYEDEDGCYMDFPSVDVLINRFEEQGILEQDKIYEAIENTNKILDFEDIILSRELKVPVAKKYKHLSQSERDEIFKSILEEEWELQKHDINNNKYDEYIKEIRFGYNEIVGCNMSDYFIVNYETMKLGIEKYGGKLTQTGRGSGVSSYINKLLKLTNVDKVNSKVEMYAERFLTKERIIESKTPPDLTIL